MVYTFNPCTKGQISAEHNYRTIISRPCNDRQNCSICNHFFTTLENRVNCGNCGFSHKERDSLCNDIFLCLDCFHRKENPITHYPHQHRRNEL